MKLNQTTWEALALFPWMVIFSAVVIDITLGLPLIADLSLLGLIIYILIAAALLVIWIVFIVHAWKSLRTEWAISIFFLSIFAYTIYWWNYIRARPSQLYESSTSFDKENIKPFLEKLSVAIDSGLDSEKINELLSFTFNVALDDQKQTEFYVTHNGFNVLIKYSVYADDIDSYGIYIFTSKELSELINSEMKDFFENHGV